MIEDREAPLLNPVLSLQIDPELEIPKGGGKGRHSIVHSRLVPQRRKLGDQLQSLFESRHAYPAFSEKTLLAARMFPDSIAPSYAPNDLFSHAHGCQLVAPLSRGYLVEVDISQFGDLASVVVHSSGTALEVDISRTSDVKSFGDGERLRGNSLLITYEGHPARSSQRFTSPGARDGGPTLAERVARRHGRRLDRVSGQAQVRT